MITEDTGKEAGLSLRNPDGTPGEWGYLWNSGDYYWQGNKVTDNEAAAIVQFYKQFNRRPFTVREAVEFDKSLGPRHDVD